MSIKIKKYITKNYKQTQKLGQLLAQEILKNPQSDKATVLCLYGDLGGGKTTFMQGFAKGLGIKQKILSPTFVIMKKFSIASSSRKRGSSEKKNQSKNTLDSRFCGNDSNFYHIDAYRLKNYKDAVELGLKEIFKNPENIVAIEWPERIKNILPKNAIKINIEFISENKRAIMIL